MRQLVRSIVNTSRVLGGPAPRRDVIAGGDPAALITAYGGTLRAFWKLDEATGSGDRVDATGRGNDLIASGLLTRGAGKVGNAVIITPDDGNYLSRPANTDLQILSADNWLWTWVKLGSTGAAFPIFTQSSDGGSSDGFALVADPLSGNTYFTVGGSLSNATVTTAPLDTNWHLVVARFIVGQEIGISIDGGSFNTVDASVIGYNASSADFIAGFDGARNCLDGSLDASGKCRFPAPLTAEQNANLLAALWNDGAGWEPSQAQS